MNKEIIKTVPCNIEAEQNVLGLLLINNENIYKVKDFLITEHFYLPIHAKIYTIINNLIGQGLSANILSTKNYLKKEKIFKELGTNSQKYLIKIFSEAKLSIDIYTLAKNIQDSYLRRKIIDINKQYIYKIRNEQIQNSAESILDEQEQELFVLSTKNNSNISCFTLNESLKKAIDRIEKARNENSRVSGIDTGYYKLNEYTGGFQNSDLIIIAGRPSMGKTAFVLNISLRIAKMFKYKSNESIAFFSLEMSAEQIASRILSIETEIDGARIRIGKIEKKEMKNLAKKLIIIEDLPLFIDETPSIKISTIRTRARRMKRQNNIKLLIVDYLQLIKTSKHYKDNRVQEIGEISQGLKSIAKELDIPIVAVSQLSRAVENRDDKRPILSDLRESGNIEQDADIVIFIYREEYYLSRKRPINENKLNEWQDKIEKVKNLAEINIAKQRNGPIGSFLLKYKNRTTTFNNVK